MGWDWIRWDGLGWDGMGWDGMGNIMFLEVGEIAPEEGSGGSPGAPGGLKGPPKTPPSAPGLPTAPPALPRGATLDVLRPPRGSRGSHCHPRRGALALSDMVPEASRMAREVETLRL